MVNKPFSKEEQKELSYEDYDTFIVFKLNDEEFGVNVAQSLRVVREKEITLLPNSPFYIEGVVSYKGKVIVVVNLKKQFDFLNKEVTKELKDIIIIEGLENENFGLLVDEVSGIERILKSVVKPPSGAISTKLPKGFVEGVALLEKRLVIIIDPVKITMQKELKKTKEEKQVK